MALLLYPEDTCLPGWRNTLLPVLPADSMATVSCKLLQQHEAALQVQVAHLTLQNMELRRELGSGWSAAEPSVMQVGTTLHRQLLLCLSIQLLCGATSAVQSRCDFSYRFTLLRW